jgi:Flp pilus assembly protein CpaB
MRLPRRLRIVLATRPLAYWSLTVAVAVIAGAVVERAVASAADARRRWGEAAPALVATRALAAGTPLDASDSEVRSIPLALVPAGALATRPANGVPLAAPVSAGEIITAARVGRGGRSATASLLPDGRRGVAVPRPDGLPLRVGDDVDVAGAGGLLTAGAVVLDVSDSAAVIAVVAADAPAVAHAAAAGDAVPVLAG